MLGLRAAGKSTVARLLAQELQRPFWDTDAELAARSDEGMSAGKLLEAWGEPRFRCEEWRTLYELLERPLNPVVATGGGAVSYPFSRELIGRRATSIYLRTETEVLRARAQQDDEFRPTLYRGRTSLDLEQQRTLREPFYLQLASVVIDTDSVQADQIALSLVDQLQTRGLL